MFINELENQQIYDNMANFIFTFMQLGILGASHENLNTILFNSNENGQNGHIPHKYLGSMVPWGFKAPWNHI